MIPNKTKDHTVNWDKIKTVEEIIAIFKHHSEYGGFKLSFRGSVSGIDPIIHLLKEK